MDAYILSKIPTANTACTGSEGNFNCLKKKYELFRTTFKITDDYHQTAPGGKLFYRGYRGDLIETDVQGIDELGAAIGDQHDYYACTVMKYLYHFTGIDVHLNDPLVTGIPLTAAEVEMRQFIEMEAEALRSSQDPRKTLENILESPYFR